MNATMELDNYEMVLETTDGSALNEGWYVSYPMSFQVSLTSFLMLEIVLGFSSNLTVLILYCIQSNLVDSVSNIVTMNLHVLDIIICLVCVPFTIVIVLIPLERNVALICCFHEACVTFTSIATAVNVLVISLDRYDISVKPANRVLTPSRTILLLTSVWVVSLMVFFVPFIEVEFFGDPLHSTAWQNRTLLCVSANEYHKELGMYYHLFIQIPCFFVAVAVMLVTYTRILQALNIRIGSHFTRSQKRKSKRRRKRPGSNQYETKKLTSAPVTPNPMPLGVQASVSVIIALRRAVKRHRDRRERQKRVFRMSLIIISTFLICWAPISIVNLLILCLGPSDWLVKLRICFLVMAYGSTIFHPLLYAFTRQKLRKVLKNKMKKRVVSVLQVDPAPSGTIIHNSWVHPRKTRKLKLECSDATDRCLTEAAKD
ncbi:G-protein coupled receptor 22-like [Stegostoma tigrinum]|uniref:G-protein coupled receptor 22-like n=1 Tax=Stegostoma tigrinum TaxID=3053191 RepID=UPI0028706F60|nr:G-protein coupled receptor 22-like [Stegostoma tigrinum]XP_048403239.2 G-protein coupled receptor 22-like [Stegostoma tigrinum]XP_048403240.2 G-protein coupled receptor 22-like [Stegostoma tigrinum]